MSGSKDSVIIEATHAANAAHDRSNDNNDCSQHIHIHPPILANDRRPISLGVVQIVISVSNLSAYFNYHLLLENRGNANRKQIVLSHLAVVIYCRDHAVDEFAMVNVVVLALYVV
jgi:hypothetical protein